MDGYRISGLQERQPGQANSAVTLVLDGRIAVYGRQLVSRFEWLRQSSPPELATPTLFMGFVRLPGAQVALKDEAKRRTARGATTIQRW